MVFDNGTCRVGDAGYVDLGVSSCVGLAFGVQLPLVLPAVAVLSLPGLGKLPLLLSFNGDTKGVLLLCLKGEGVGEVEGSGRRKGELRGDP